MNNLEDILHRESENMKSLNIPESLEENLRSALDNTKAKKKRNYRVRIAALAAILLLTVYNADTLAYYGKRLIGYDSIMSGTVRELNELGEGQLIGKSYEFRDGTKVVLDGIMLDDNSLMAFFTIQKTERNEDDMNEMFIESSFGNRYYGSGVGTGNGSKSEMRWALEYDVPKFYEKSMKLKFNYNGENGEIPFKIDRSMAIGKGISFSINKEVKLDQRSITLDTLDISAMSSKLEGRVQNIIELGIDYITNNRFRMGAIDIKLIADGEEVELTGSGMRTGYSGSEFEIIYDTVPKDTKVLQLKLEKFSGDHDAKEKIKLEKGIEKEFQILGQDIRISDVYEKDGNTYITFTTEENTVLSRVYLNIDGERKQLQETILGDIEKIVKTEETTDISMSGTARIEYTRTMRFEGTGEELQLEIDRITYAKSYDEIIWEQKQ